MSSEVAELESLVFDIPNEWKVTTLASALEKSEGGGTPPRDVVDYWNGNIPWASVKDVVKGEGFEPEETISPAGLANSTSKLIPAGTNIFAARMGVGAVVRYPFAVAINQDLMALTPSSELDPGYLFYWLQNNKEAFLAVATGTTVKGIRKDVLLSFPIILPPLDEQRRIACVLQSLDEAISANELVATQAGRAYEVALAELVGGSHDHWETARLGEIAELSLGKMLDKVKNKGELHPYLANINVRWGSFDLQHLREMRFEEREFERYMIRAGDIVMCEGGEPGRCALWMDEVPGMMIQKALHRIRPTERIDCHFLYYALFHKGKSGAFDEYLTGGGIKHLPGVQLGKVEVSFPSVDEQRRISEVLRSMDEAIAVGQTTTEKTRNIKSHLMSDLLSGRVRVPI